MSTKSIIENRTASTEIYDPWLDYNEDGYIGIDDVYTTAQHFGAEGDPAKPIVKVIRFCSNSSEFEIPATTTRVARFYWYPQHDGNNVLISVSCFMEYFKNESSAEPEFTYKVRVWDNEYNVWDYDSYRNYQITAFKIWQWTECYYRNTAVKPNRLSYRFDVEVIPNQGECGYIRNINLMITIADGIIPIP
jgi:hypothetical protein